MEVNVERLGANKVALNLELGADEVDRTFNQIYKEFGAKTSIPGFRKGKAPRALLERYIGVEQIRQRVTDILIPKAYREALEKSGLEPIEQAQVEVIQLEESKPLIFKATVEVKPEVQLCEYKGIKVEKGKKEATDAAVNEELERLREEHAELVETKRKTIREGDIAVVNIDVFKEGKLLEGKSSEGIAVEVGAKRFVPTIDEHLVGAKVGDEFKLEVTYPQDYPYKELAGEEAELAVSIKALEMKKLPPLDDKFTKKVSECGSLGELKQQIKKNLEMIADAEADKEVAQKLVDKVTMDSVVEVPQKMVETEVDRRITGLEDELRRRGYTLERYLKEGNKDLGKLRKELEVEALGDVKRQLVLEAIASKEGIEVSDEEVDAEIESLAARYQMEPSKMKALLTKEDALHRIINNIWINKIIQILINNANIIIKEGG